jgi:hypothetical protein
VFLTDLPSIIRSLNTVDTAIGICHAVAIYFDGYVLLNDIAGLGYTVFLWCSYIDMFVLLVWQ